MQLAEDIYTTFNPDKYTLDAHFDSYFSEHKVQSLSDETFLRQVVYGCTRYSTLLTAIMTALYHYCGGVVLRKDRTTYKLYAYLAVIRLDDLGVENFAMLVSSQPAQKMLPFLKFLFDDKYVKEDLADEWLRTYDRSFVEECTGIPPISSSLRVCDNHTVLEDYLDAALTAASLDSAIAAASPVFFRVNLMESR